MKNYCRWAALAGAVVLTLSEPFQIFADEAVHDGTSIENAIIVPSAGETQLSQPFNEIDTTSAAQGNTSVVQPDETTLIENGNQTNNNVNTNPSTNPGTAEIPNMNPGTAQNSGTNPGTAEIPNMNPGTAQNPGTTENSNTNTSTNTSTTRVIRTGGDSSGNTGNTGSTGNTTAPDYSLGPGYVVPSESQEQPQQPPTLPEDNQLEQPDPSMVFQTVQGQTLSGVNRLAEGILLYDVPNSIVQPMEKYSYEQMVWDLNRLQTQYSGKIHIRSIGTSLDGRKIYDCIIGNLQAPRHILIQGGIHAREYLNPMMMMQQMEMILANYDVGLFHGSSLSSMFSQVAVHFVPMTNPDGISISQFGVDRIRSQEIKDAIGLCYVMDTAAGKGGDIATYLSRWKANARGVDLNLNFDALWAETATTGYPSSSGFKGEMPASEPETQALINLYNNPQYPWKSVIHYHSMGNVIYWDIRGNKVQEDSAQLANLMSNVTGGYQILPSTGGGGFKDWIQLSERPVPSVTLETGKSTCPMPLSEYSSIWNSNCLTWAYVMEWVAIR